MKLTARVASIHAIFQLTVRRIRMFFSLKPSQSQAESSLKISARWVSPLGNKQTDSLTHKKIQLMTILCKERFVMPEERKMKFQTFLQLLEQGCQNNEVLYIQKQNSNLTQEFPDLMQQVLYCNY